MSQSAAGSHELGGIFQSHRRFLFGLSYRLTGSADDAQDVVQEAFVRAMEQPLPGLGDAWRRWLARVVVNLSIDALRRRRRRRYAGPWLPEPLVTGGDAAELAADRAALDAAPRDGIALGSPEARYELLESVSFAFLLALEALKPRQRAALILQDVFDYSAREVADCLGTSEGNVRVLLHRARTTMRGYDRAPRRPSPELEGRTRAALEEFLRCLLQQDAAGLERLLTEDARTLTDSAGEYTALAKPLFGRHAVMRLYLRVAKRRAAGARIERCLVNGSPALLIEFASTVRSQAPRVLLRCDLDAAGRIEEVHVILASRKLAALGRSGS
jgi:RNA polymerase sigma-70 factor (ECF subfamily)